MVDFLLCAQEMKAAKGYATLRAARTEARLVGVRQKMKAAKEEKGDSAPAATD